TAPNALINPATDDLGNLGTASAYASDINTAGDVVGSSYLPGGLLQHAFLFRAGVMTDLGTLGERESFALAINDSGQVVGTAETYNYDSGGFHHRPFLWENGVMVDLRTLVSLPPGWVLDFAVDINNAGQILCQGYSNDPRASGSVAFLLDP